MVFSIARESGISNMIPAPIPARKNRMMTRLSFIVVVIDFPDDPPGQQTACKGKNRYQESVQPQYIQVRPDLFIGSHTKSQKKKQRNDSHHGQPAGNSLNPLNT